MSQKNATNGKDYEKELINDCDWLLSRKLGRIIKLPDPMRVLGMMSGGLMKCSKSTPYEVDFAGYLWDGRAVRFEAKLCSGKSVKDRFPFGRLEGGKDKPYHMTQRYFLSSCAAFNGIAFVMVRWVHQHCRLCGQRGFVPDDDNYCPDCRDERGRTMPTRTETKDYVFPVDGDGVIASVTDRKSIRWDEAEAFALATGEDWFDKVVQLYDLTLPPTGERRGPSIRN